MTVDEMTELFEKIQKEGKYTDFKDLENKFSEREDLHAFILLEKLLPDKKESIVACAEHDQIWLSVDLEELAAVATEEDISQFVACGIFIDQDSLSMFA